MSTALDLKIIPKVISTLNKVGIDVKLKIMSSKDHDPVTGDVIEGPVKVYEVKSSPIFKAKSKPNDVEVIDHSGEVIIAGNGLDLTDDHDMKIEISGQDWIVKSIEAIRSGDDVAAYVLKVGV